MFHLCGGDKELIQTIPRKVSPSDTEDRVRNPSLPKHGRVTIRGGKVYRDNMPAIVFT